jgi:hypothetical protein
MEMPPKENSGGPAFPRTGNYDDDGTSNYDSTSQDGMTLRDYFAAKAMQAIVGHPATSTQGKEFVPELARMTAEVSWLFADAMLAARDA